MFQVSKEEFLFSSGESPEKIIEKIGRNFSESGECKFEQYTEFPTFKLVIPESFKQLTPPEIHPTFQFCESFDEELLKYDAWSCDYMTKRNDDKKHEYHIGTCIVIPAKQDFEGGDLVIYDASGEETHVQCSNLEKTKVVFLSLDTYRKTEPITKGTQYMFQMGISLSDNHISILNLHNRDLELPAGSRVVTGGLAPYGNLRIDEKSLRYKLCHNEYVLIGMAGVYESAKKYPLTGLPLLPVDQDTVDMVKNLINIVGDRGVKQTQCKIVQFKKYSTDDVNCDPHFDVSTDTGYGYMPNNSRVDVNCTNGSFSILKTRLVFNDKYTAHGRPIYNEAYEVMQTGILIW